MNNQVALLPEKAGEIMEAVIAKGDLGKLMPEERAKYYTRVCTSMGLNPLTKPFEYITLNGKLTLYARKDCTDQLRKIYGVSVDDMTEKREADLIVVTVKVRDAGGRTDMAKGAVTLKGLQGEALANALMKAETKAKRRATLSICGLGFLDETEIETIPQPRILKKDVRPDYLAMQRELDGLNAEGEFIGWMTKNGDRLAALPTDWQSDIRTIIDTKCEWIRDGGEPPASGEILSDQWSDHQAQNLRNATQTHAPEEPTELWTEDGETPPEWSSKWDELGPVKQAGILCSDGAFWKFLSKMLEDCYVDSESAAVVVVRQHCGVGSRSALATSPEAASKWRNLVSDYRAWQREPELIEPDSASITVPKSAASHPSPAHNEAADNQIPTAADYYDQWHTIISGATNDALLSKTWNDQAELRKLIEWTDEHPFKPLQKRVRDAVEFLKADAS